MLKSILIALTKPSKLDLMVMIEEIIERDTETCATFVSNELGIDLKQANSLIRGLCHSEGIFKGEMRNKEQFYTLTKPRNIQQSLLDAEPARRDPLVAFLFGEAK